MKISKKIWFILSFIFVGFIYVFATAINVKAASSNVSIYLSSDNSTVTDSEGHTLYLSSGSSVSFYINMNGRFASNSTSVRVNYRTVDYSANASLKDYDSNIGSVTLSNSSTSKKVQVSVHQTKMVVDNNYNAFKFEIESIEVSDDSTASIDSGKKMLYGACNASYKYTTSSSNHNVIKEYYEPQSMGLNRYYRSDDSKWYVYEFWHYEYPKPSKMYSYEQNFVMTGLADLYMGGYFKGDSSHTLDWSDDEIRLSFATYSRNSETQWFYRLTKDDIMFDYDTMYLGSSGSNEYRDGSTAVSTSGRSYSKYIKVPNYGKAEQGFEVEYYGDDICKADIYDLNIDILLMDNKKPVVEKWAISSSKITRNDDLFVTCRFNEPIRASSNTVLVCSLDTIGQTKVNFNYYGGSGTNTLVFKANGSTLLSDKTKNLYCTEITPCSLQTSSGTVASIYDYGLNTSNQNNQATNYVQDPGSTFSAFLLNGGVDPKSLGCRLYVDFDLRRPQIDPPYLLSDVISKTQKVSFKVNEADEDAKIYYTWSTNSEPFTINNVNDIPSMYEFYQDNLGATMGLANNITIEGSNMDGAYYLHVLVLSNFGNTDGDHVFKPDSGLPFKFDNSAPVITKNEVSGDYRDKTIELTITDGNEVYCSQLFNIYLYLTKDKHLLTEMSQTNDVVEGVTKKLLYSSEITTNNVITYNELKGVYELKLNAYDGIIGLNQGEYGRYYMGFQVVDNAGNYNEVKDIQFNTYDFDTRDLFDTEYSIAGYAEYEDTTTRTFAIDISQNPTIRISKVEMDVGALGVDSIKYNGQDFNVDDFYTNVVSNDTYISFKPNTSLQPGCYEVTFGYDKNTEGVYNKVSKLYKFYFSSTLQDGTSNKTYLDSHGVLINTVYQLNQPYYYYKNSEEQVIQEPYGNVVASPTFSSKAAAYNYVRYMEYLDLNVYYVSDQSYADLLNGGLQAERKKAFNETHQAKPGDYYIRYKRYDWTIGDMTSSGWVYYFYSDTVSEIIVENLPKNLSDALEQVINRIVDDGAATFLADDQLDKYGSPYLREGQYHSEEEEASTTKSGSRFKNVFLYSGDKNLFSSTVKYLDTEYRLLANYVFEYNDYTRVFYKLKESSSPYSELLDTQPRLAGAVNKAQDKEEEAGASGVYSVMEIDENGINKFEVYIDCASPTIKVQAVNKTDDEEPIPQDISRFNGNNKTFNARSFNIIDIEDIDHFGYVALYKVDAISISLVRVLSYSEIKNFKGELEQGNYLVKVFDRSGNNYTFNLRLNDTDLIVSVIENPNINIRIECNREEDDIQTYQIRFNGQLIADKYAPTATFYDNGIYDIYIADWYGGLYNESYEFSRSLPDISWHYENGTTAYVYDGTQEGLFFQSVSETEYNVYTNGTLGVIFASGSEYSYSFIGNEPKVNSGYDGAGRRIITVNSTTNYTIKIFYEKYEDVYMIYNVYYDDKNPIINASIQQIDYLHTEIEELSQYMGKVSNYQNGETDPEKIIIPNPSMDGENYIPRNGIGYYYNGDDTLTYYFADGSLVSSNYIEIDVSDDSKVVKCLVYLNGELLSTYANDQGIEGFVLSREGEYSIVAYDALGNFSTFTFTNSMFDQCKASVDGNQAVFDDTNYGHDSIQLETSLDGTVEFYVIDKYKDLSGEEVSVVSFYAFVIENGYVKEQKIIYDCNAVGGIEMSMDKVVYSPTDKGVYSFGIQEGLDFSLELIDGKYTFTFVSEQKHEYEIQTKFYTTRFEPVMYGFMMSKGGSPAYLNIEGELFDINNGEELYLHNPFIVEKPLEGSGVTYIALYDNENPEEGIVIYNNVTENDVYNRIEFAEDGGYVLEVYNQYGVFAYSLISLQKSLVVIKEATMSDGKSYTYSGNYKDDIYASEKVEMIVYSENPIIVCEHDGQVYPLALSKGNNKTLFTLEGNGKYSLYIEDEHLNVVEFDVYIQNKLISFPSQLLTGFNEKALKKDDGYTNTKLSINKAEIENNEIASISIKMKNSEDEVMIYDLISENKVMYTDESFDEIIGNEGTGIYQIIIRDIYGNSAIKEIHYSEDSSLILSRSIRSNGNYEDYDIELAMSAGFYSNNTLRFETTSNNYIFKVNNKVEELKYTLSFQQGEENVSYDYAIYYVDEYGFEYNFNACLARVDVNIEATNIEDFIEHENILTTRKNFQVTFKEGATCTYIFNKNTYPYVEGMILKEDGIYRFQAVDFAGNLSTVTYKKDSICEYKILDTMADKVLLCGDVANNKNVSFSAINGDDSYIYQGFLNGEKLGKEIQEGKFTESGHYELLIKDGVGNSSYYDFYILAHPIKGFAYETPMTYFIESINYTPAYSDGGVVSVLNYVEEGEYNSKFKFGSVGDYSTDTEDGYYEVKMYSPIYGTKTSFYFTINNISPNVELVGCEENEETLNDITLSGVEVDDTIKIFKDGKLTKTIKYKDSGDLPTISDGGEYVIEITNQAGLKQELRFKRRHVSNGAGSALIIVMALAFIIVLFIGLVYRTKSKVDK